MTTLDSKKAALKLHIIDFLKRCIVDVRVFNEDGVRYRDLLDEDGSVIISYFKSEKEGIDALHNMIHESVYGGDGPYEYGITEDIRLLDNLIFYIPKLEPRELKIRLYKKRRGEKASYYWKEDVLRFSIDSLTPSLEHADSFLVVLIHELAHRKQIKVEGRKIPYTAGSNWLERVEITQSWSGKINPKDWLTVTDSEIDEDLMNIGNRFENLMKKSKYTFYKAYAERMESIILSGNSLSADDMYYITASFNRGYTDRDSDGKLDIFDDVLTELFARIKSLVAIKVDIDNLNDIFGSDASIKSLFQPQMIYQLDRFVWGLPYNEGRYE